MIHTFTRLVGIPGVGNAGYVESGLIYRSAQPSGPMGYTALRDLWAIKTVLNLQDETDPDQPADMPVRWFPLCALEPVSVAKYTAILTAIEAAPKPILVHCLQGHDRTGVVCAAWRIIHGWPLADAIEEMEAYGFNPLWLPLKNSLVEFAKSAGGK